MAKNIILTVQLVLLAVLVLTTLFDTSNACNTSRRHRRFHNRHHYHHVGKRDVSANTYNSYNVPSTTDWRTTCGASVCAATPNYPFTKISEVVNEVRKIMSSRDVRIQERIRLIDEEVVTFHSHLNRKVDDDEEEEDNNISCHVRKSVSLLEEGQSIDDDRKYYIVNIPSLEQQVQIRQCVGAGGQCYGDLGTAEGTCEQNYREEKLLVLPMGVRNRDFDVREFKIKTFQVPDGCQCTVLQNEFEVVSLDDPARLQ